MADLFEEKAKDWDVNDMVQQLSHGISHAILNRIELDTEMKVMDFGAGTGLISSNIAPKVGRITAVDISESMLEQLAAKPALQGKVDIACQNILEQPLPDRYQLIVSAMAMHHVKDTQAMMKRFNEHLQPGGMVALADLDSEDGTFHPAGIEGVYHDGFDRESLTTVMKDAGFEEIEFTTAHTVNKEGKQYPVFLVTAQKA